ncbi:MULTISPECIES: hypothetical protein [unclassified Actinotalea]|uniref:hypothetical protein n=1 Tax=unclassified Actinotalea TaxID=2638618 RepID=UPI0015F44388|nr:MULTISPECIES: hypothetical protein [unclassified Actinotalea]
MSRTGQVELFVPPLYDLLWAVVGFGTPLALVAAIVVVALRGGRGRSGGISRTASVARRHAVGVHLAAWVAALVALPLMGYGGLPGPPEAVRAYATALGGSSSFDSGSLVALVPAGVGLAFLLVHAVGELTWPRPTGTVRRATLRPRRVVDVAPAGARRVTWAWGAVLFVVLLACGLTAEPDGRSLGRTSGAWVVSHSPFPGWHYGVSLLAAAALVLGAQEGVLRLITRRPAVADAAEAWDLGLRRLSAHRVLRGTQLVLGCTVGAVLVVAGTSVRAVGDDHAPGAAAGGSTAYVLGGTALVVLGLASLLVAMALTLRQGDAVAAPAVDADDALHDAAR